MHGHVFMVVTELTTAAYLSFRFLQDASFALNVVEEVYGRHRSLHHQDQLLLLFYDVPVQQANGC